MSLRRDVGLGDEAAAILRRPSPLLEHGKPLAGEVYHTPIHPPPIYIYIERKYF